VQTRERLLVVLFTFLCLVVASRGMAQLPTAAVVPGTSLTARNVDTGQTRQVSSGDDGSYSFAGMLVGNHTAEGGDLRKWQSMSSVAWFGAPTSGKSDDFKGLYPRRNLSRVEDTGVRSRAA
jgi:hypothetical protein